MKSFSELYDIYSKINGISDVAHFILFEKYIEQNLKGKQKMFQIDSTDQESKLSGLPIPGMIYTFIYKGKSVDVILKKAKEGEYSDYVPIVLCMGVTDDSLIGINLNVLPSDVRLTFLDGIYNAFPDFFSKVDNLTANQKLAINDRFIRTVETRKGKELIKTLNSIHGQKYSFAYRKYKFKHIIQFRMIEISEWLYIPFYTPVNAFRKMNYQKIHQIYYQKLNN